MVVHEKKALHALHRLLQQGRWLAGEGASTQTLFCYFDELDGLMGYVTAWQTDKTSLFQSELARVCAQYQAQAIIEEYNRT